MGNTRTKLALSLLVVAFAFVAGWWLGRAAPAIQRQAVAGQAEGKKTVSDTDQRRQQERMKRWRNVACPQSEPDAEMVAIDKFEDSLGVLPPKVERIRALISRIDPLSHYKAFDNLDFLMTAIGKLDYPRYPAIDVLSRHGQLDNERLTQVQRYVYCLEAWLAGKSLAEAAAERKDCPKLIEKTYTELGDRTDEKRWLVMAMVKTLKEHAYSPWHFIAEAEDADFVRAVYFANLKRPPSPDDLKFRVEGLRGGKTRHSFFLEVFGSAEHQRRKLGQVAGIIKRPKEE